MVADIIVLFAWVALFLLRDSWWKMSTCDRLSPLALSRATGNDSLRILASYCLRWPRQRTELCHRTADSRSAHPHSQPPVIPAGSGAGYLTLHWNPRPTAVLIIDLDHFKSSMTLLATRSANRVPTIFADTAIESISLRARR